YSGPSVTGGRVFVMDRLVPTDAPKPKSPFDATRIPGNERVLCFDEADGHLLWKHEYDCPYDVSYSAGPRATPLVSGGRVYAVGTMGNLTCLNATNGHVLWAHDFKTDYGLKIPTWGVSANPLIDGQKLICLVGGEGTVAVAFDKDTGKELWRALSAREPGYCPPTIYEFGGRRQLILWHAEAVNGLDPETGKVLWTEPWKLNYGMSIATPRKVGDQLFLTCFYNGSMMLRFEAGKDAPVMDWRTEKMSERNTTHLNCTMSTPFIEDGYIYGSCSYGQYRCLRADTGERMWETYAPTSGKSERWGNCFTVKNGSRFFLFSEKGDLIIAHLSPKGYEEISRAHLVDPVNQDPGRGVVWTHPAFANRRVYVRNDKELVCVDLADK
ncbi:MAG TPA: PQQ-binding-like beta-propeller repeat protein, partial [Candidatus Limnocylindria bacterium]|nr:PQQ-binding-like beta-propeller repeat protein [Candidatus Limnocylindria bacterium]